MTELAPHADPQQHGETGRAQPLWFLVVFALAVGGGSIAYVPLLTVLLPLKVSMMTGQEDVSALAQMTFLGAVFASLANIAFGMLSDRSGSRLPWIAGGLVLSTMGLLAIGASASMAQLMVLIVLWQVGLNMMLGPMFAWAGDCFPDSQKGLLGGAFAVAPALGAIAGSLVTFENFIPPEHRYAAIAVMVSGLVLPVLLLGRGRVRPELVQNGAMAAADVVPHERSTVLRMWMARFLVQISEAGLFAFLLFWLRSLVPAFHENTAANIFSMVLVVAVPLALVIGRWSDRRARPLVPLWVTASVASAGLITMAASNTITVAIAGYVVFAIAAAVFLSLHTGQTLRVLPQPRHRGRDMGIFNLTNTLPSIVMPWLTLSLVPGFGFTALFALFACFALIAAVLLMTIPVRR